MPSVFLDTVGILAVLNKNDPYHRVVLPIWEKLITDDEEFFTTEFVMLELSNAMSRSPFVLRNDLVVMRLSMKRDNRLVYPPRNSQADVGGNIPAAIPERRAWLTWCLFR